MAKTTKNAKNIHLLSVRNTEALNKNKSTKNNYRTAKDT